MSFFRNQNLFSSHSRNTKYQGTQKAPEFFYTHNFKKSLNRFSPNLVLKKKNKRKSLLWYCNYKCQVSIQSKFLQLSWQVFKEVLSKQKPSRTQRKKKKEKSYLPYDCSFPRMWKWRLVAILHRQKGDLGQRRCLVTCSFFSFLPSRKRVFSMTRNGHSHSINSTYPVKVLLEWWFLWVRKKPHLSRRSSAPSYLNHRDLCLESCCGDAGGGESWMSVGEGCCGRETAGEKGAHGCLPWGDSLRMIHRFV